MKKTIIKIVVILLTFIVSLIVISKIMNQGTNNLTMEMAPASLPIVTLDKDGILYNELHGYKDAMNVAFQRDTMTELGPNREVAFQVDPFGNDIASISIEVRSTDGQRLIENSEVVNLEKKDGRIYGSTTLKDLIEQDSEYALVILLNMDHNQVIRYYTRIIWSENTFAKEKIQFVQNFHEKTYDKEKAKELVTYLESNSKGDNTTFYQVDIHSSFQQITWGDLNVVEAAKPSISIKELASQTASIHLKFVVSITEEKTTTFYLVTEYFRIRYTPDRTYLLDYERTMTQMPRVESNIYANDKIMLGIVDPNTPFVESEDGNVVVFNVANRLCSYNVSTNKLAILFSFYNDENMDVRTLYDQHNIKIFDTDEGGNVQFAVYGYMNRGRHEGEIGIQIYNYDSTLNTIEEVVYIPYDKTFTVLQKEMEQLLYMNRENNLYFFLEDTVYGVYLSNNKFERIVTITQDGSMHVSNNQKILVWQEGTDIYHSTSLMVKNLNDGTISTIEASTNEFVRPLGFMGEDIIYGVAKEEDIRFDNTGRVFFPMYKICIQNAEGQLLKTYSQSNIYVTGCNVLDNQIILDRLLLNENGEYTETTQDQIMNNLDVPEGRNKLEVVSIDKYLKYVQIQFHKTIDSKTIKILTPKEVLFEGGRELVLKDDVDTPRYYVYGAEGVAGIFNAPSKAVELAYSISGVVVNNQGDFIWQKGNRSIKNQIMAIKELTLEDGQSSLAACLDTMLKLEGVIRNSQFLLNQGETVADILNNNLENVQVLDLTGCNLDSVLHYVNQDFPVLATLKDGESVLITGFNQFNVVIVDAQTGIPYKKGINDSTEWFEENGNQFITYIIK